MKIYKLAIDTTQPIKQALRVPVGETKYGIAVNVLKGDHTIRNLSCTIDVAGQTLEPTKQLDDGSYLFELQSMDGECVANVHAKADAMVFEGQTTTNTSGRAKNSFLSGLILPAGEYYNDEINPFGYRTSPVSNTYDVKVLNKSGAAVVGNVDRMTYQLADPNKNLYFYTDGGATILPSDTKLIISADVGVYGQTVSIPAHSTITMPDSYVGYNVDCYVDVTLKSAKDSQPDMIIDDPVDFTNVDATNLSADNFTLSGVTYVPTALTVDGVSYTVLAAPVTE